MRVLFVIAAVFCISAFAPNVFIGASRNVLLPNEGVSIIPTGFIDTDWRSQTIVNGDKTAEQNAFKAAVRNVARDLAELTYTVNEDGLVTGINGNFVSNAQGEVGDLMPNKVMTIIVRNLDQIEGVDQVSPADDIVEQVDNIRDVFEYLYDLVDTYNLSDHRAVSDARKRRLVFLQTIVTCAANRANNDGTCTGYKSTWNSGRRKL